MSKVISVISGKGGTGKSTVSAGVALALAKRAKTVLLIDLDIGLRSLDIMLAMENIMIFDIGDIFSGACTFKKAVVAHPFVRSLHVLCSPLTVSSNFDIDRLIKLIKTSKTKYDYVVLDLPAGVGLSVILTKELCDQAIIVTTFDTVTVRDSRKICDILAREQTLLAKIIVNRVEKEQVKSSSIADIDEIMDSIGAPLLGVIKEDRFIKSVLVNGLDPQNDKSKIVKTFSAIASRIDGTHAPIVIKSV